jgi:hypothetical protein
MKNENAEKGGWAVFLQADARNDPLAAPFADVLEAGKRGEPPLLPWTAGAEELPTKPSSSSSDGGASDSFIGDTDGNGVPWAGAERGGGEGGQQAAPKSILLERPPPQRQERMLRSSEMLISPGAGDLTAALVLSCLALSRRVLSCLACLSVSCRVLSCLASARLGPYD